MIPYEAVQSHLVKFAEHPDTTPEDRAAVERVIADSRLVKEVQDSLTAHFPHKAASGLMAAMDVGSVIHLAAMLAYLWRYRAEIVSLCRLVLGGPSHAKSY